MPRLTTDPRFTFDRPLKLQPYQHIRENRLPKFTHRPPVERCQPLVDNNSARSQSKNFTSRLHSLNSQKSNNSPKRSKRSQERCAKESQVQSWQVVRKKAFSIKLQAKREKVRQRSQPRRENNLQVVTKRISNPQGQRKKSEGQSRHLYYSTQNKKLFLRGRDNSQSQYVWVKHEALQDRYELIEELGKGSFGVVVKAIDHKEKCQVALKIIRSKKRLSEQALIQIKLLRFCNDHQEGLFVKLKDFFYFKSHVVLVFQLLHINLYDYLKSHRFKGVSQSTGRLIAIQLLFSLLFLSKHSIIHTDIKPQNVMLTEMGSTQVKIVDFGSSCFEDQKLYSYIQSRYYRAPQIMLQLNYSTQIDMWSFGCILAQLFIGYPLFPGQNELEQLGLIQSCIGAPPEALVIRSNKLKYFNQKGRIQFDPDIYSKKLPHQLLRLQQIFNKTLFVDFMKSVFQWEAENRVRPQEALLHRWIIDGMQPDQKQQHIRQVHKMVSTKV